MNYRTQLRAGLFVVAAPFVMLTPALAQTADTGFQPGQVLVHIDAVGVFKDASAKVYVGGGKIPGASVSSPPDPSISFDLDYFLTPHIAIDAYAGLPPHTQVNGAGTIKPLKTLATFNYGPAVLSAEYRFDRIGGFSPYAAVGLNYTIFMNVHHDALYNVKIPDAFGAAFKVGFDYRINRSWSANFYVLHVLLGTRVSATADPGGTVPAVAKSTINPTIIGGGIGYAF
jgi:outer membrane protein